MLQGILLAAGKSTRFGSNKLRHRMHDGLPMIIHSANKLVWAVDNLVVVIDENDHALSQLLNKHGFKSIPSPHCDLGMGHTIADAVSATHHASAWMIGLGDMPYVAAKTVASIAEKYRETGSICVPYYNNRRGHPVVFPHAYGDALAQLAGDSGARSILEAASTFSCRISVDDPGILADVDTPADVRH
jgi:molybdenum cofactor cytidylyltransferase